MKTIKKPISILLALMMVVSLFAIVPITASAAETYERLSFIDVEANAVSGEHFTAQLYDNSGQDEYGWCLDCDYPDSQYVILSATDGTTINKLVLRSNSPCSLPAVSVNGQDLSYTITDTTAPDGDIAADYTFENVNATEVKIYSVRNDRYYFYMAWADVYYTGAASTTHTVTWKNGDTVLETDADVAAGSPAVYNGATPTKDGVTFAGWTDSQGVFYAKDATLPEVTADETYTAVFELTIGSVDEWNSFAAAVKGGNTYSGVIVRMTADVGPVTTMAEGTFSGTFDGEGHTLTVNISGGAVATFEKVANATFRNLVLAGSVTGTAYHTAALVKSISGSGATCTIKNVDIYVDVKNSKEYIGGFIGHATSSNTVIIENSVFAGSISKTGAEGLYTGGFVGWSGNSDVTVNNCAFTGSYSNVKSFNTVGFAIKEIGTITVNNIYSNVSDKYTYTGNGSIRMYVPGSYQAAVALVENGDEKTFYSAFSDALAAWTDDSTLALLADVTYDSQITVPANTSKILDLNGKTLTTVANNTVYGTLTIQSTVSAGNITHTNNSQVISVQEEATLNINSGTIHGYNADCAVIGGEGGTYNLNGGKIVTSASNAFSIGSGSTLNLNGGEIECTSGSTSMGTASAVWAHGDSTINWNGTAITTNTGDGIRMKSAGNGTVNVTGGSFTATSSSLPEEGGYAIYCNSNMGTLNLEGNPSISGRGIYLADDKMINITGTLSNTNPISVTMQTPGVFTSGLSGNGDASNFANGNGTGYALTLNASGEAQIVPAYTVTWKNYDDSVIGTSTVNAGETPAFSDTIGEIKAKPEDADNTYTFSGWSDGTTTYGTTDPLPPVTGDVTYTAQFTAKPKTLIVGHSLTLDGNIGINFYLDPSVAGMTADRVTADNLSYSFAWANGNALVDVAKQAESKAFVVEDGKIKVTCKVCAAEMTCGVKASFKLGNKSGSEVYTVRKYCDTVLDPTSAFSTKYKSDNGEGTYNNLVDLTNKMLDYGAKAQTVFRIKTYDLANHNLKYTMQNVDGDMFTTAVQTANGRVADDIAAKTPAGASFKAPSLVFLSENTLRLYFEPQNDSFSTAGLTKWNQYYYAQVVDIPAAKLDTLQTFNVSGTELRYSALDYAKALAAGGNTDNAALAMALYWYNRAANVFFNDPAHTHTPGEPVQENVVPATCSATGSYDEVVYCSECDEEFSREHKTIEKLAHTPGAAVRENVVPATCSATGSYDEVVYCTECHAELSREHKTIEKLAHTIIAVPEKPATAEATGVKAHYKCSVCGKLFTDANGKNETTAAALVIPKLKIIVLDNVTKDTTVEDGYTVIGTLKGNYKISIASGATVTLQGVNITNLGKNCNWAGISCPGNATLVLKGKNTVCAGLDGSGNNNYPGIWIAQGKTLTINGDGSLTAYSNKNKPYAAGIGGGYEIGAGNIVINGGTIIANGGEWAAGIGSGYKKTCGTITINGGTITATGGKNAAGIGSGANGSSCGNITINRGTIKANGGQYGAGIGSGATSSSCGNITINRGTITATGGQDAAGIGSGTYASSCGKITISASVTSVTATKGSGAPDSIGTGSFSDCGTVTIGGVAQSKFITVSPYTYKP